MRGDLISYDSYIAGYLSRLIDGQEVEPERLSPNVLLERRLEELGERRPELRPFVYDCLDYLNTVHGIVGTVGERRRGSGL